LLFCVASAALAGAMVGFLTSLGGVLKDVRSLTVPVFAAALVLAAAGVAAGSWFSFGSVARVRDSLFIAWLAALWLLSRLAVVLAFPRAVLVADDAELHQFVVALRDGGFGAAHLARMSASYDYQVWLSRAFPVYYPLRVWFGDHDVFAVRLLNVALGAATLVLTFLILRRLCGTRAARVAAWLLTFFPCYFFNVIGYDPQIPGTLFFVAGVWLALGAFQKRPVAPLWLILRGAALGASLFLAGVQRGGVDLLLFAILLVFAALRALRRGSLSSQRGALAVLAVALIVWWPARSGVASWIHSHDAYGLRSHQLGFLTRGWNLPQLGEYLLRYEQLDIASPPADKKRVLLSVLATQVVREPVATLGAVPLAKVGKFFLLGYTANIEPALSKGGYGGAARFSKALQVAYTPLLLFLSMAGLAAALKSNAMAWRLALPLLAIVSAASAIVLLWETSPRYSQCVHFAFAGAAAVGYSQLRRGLRPALTIGAVPGKRFLLVVAAAGLLWVGFAAALSAGLRSASSYLFADIRHAEVTLADRPLRMEPLHRWTTPWEETIELENGVALPAKLRIAWPTAGQREGGDWNMSVWLPTPPAEPWASCRIVVPAADHHEMVYQLRDLAAMKRSAWTDVSPDNGRRAVDVVLLPPLGQTGFSPSGPITLAFGYIQQVGP
jgi:hypothetical protein